MSLQSSDIWSLVCHSERDAENTIVVDVEEWKRHLQQTCADSYRLDKILYTSNERKMALEHSDFKENMEIADERFLEMLSLQLLLSKGEDGTEPAFDRYRYEDATKKASLQCLPSKSEESASTEAPSTVAVQPALEEEKNGDAAQPLLEEGKKRDAESQKACCSIM